MFKLYDMYEGRELIGTYEKQSEVAKACTKYASDTDDECCFELRQFNADTDKYTLIKNWTYSNANIAIK